MGTGAASLGQAQGRLGTAVAGAGEPAVGELSNDALIIRLHFTPNHLSRWLTPIHDQSRLQRSVRRGEPSVKELVLRLRDEEERVFPMMHAITVRTSPDLDKLPPPRRTPEDERRDREATAIEVMAEFRRLRQSTCSLLRGLPDSAWERVGISRRTHDWTLRALAEHLVGHDVEVLYEMDVALDRAGAREGIATASRVHLPELLQLAPADRRGT
jgi:hypothetical protein